MNESTTFAYKNNTLSNGKRMRNTVNAAELKEFRTQAECLGLYDPVILSSNHEYENCRSFKNPDYKQIILKMFARLRDITENL
ncbi:hypothetical protein NQZ68_010689 [Dissostichus eleginoides]|nr:hypothetical protein NQZ68_010689 [Dissostichus eleginoides]